MQITDNAVALATTTATDPSATVVSALDQWITWSQNVGWAIAILCFVIVGIIFMIPSEQGMTKGKRYAVGILIGIMAITVGPAVVGAMRA